MLAREVDILDSDIPGITGRSKYDRHEQNDAILCMYVIKRRYRTKKDGYYSMYS